MIEAKIIVCQRKHELALRKSEDFGKICRAVARFGNDNIAMIALEMGKQLALLGIARIIANDDFDVRTGPGTGLRDSRTRQQIVPVRR